MSFNVAFIGLGVMGYPMAGYISKAGHNVTVYNRTAAKADKWITEYKGAKADTPAKAAEGADFIFTCVGNDDNLREVSLGENGLFKTAKEGCVYIDNSTVSAEISRELYKAAKDKGFDFLDAPISGGQAGAEGGILTVMVGGDEEVFKKAEPVIDCYSRKVKLIGATGSGQLTKMMNQMCKLELCKVCRKRSTLELMQVLIWIKLWKLYQRVLLNLGRWKTDTEL